MTGRIGPDGPGEPDEPDELNELATLLRGRAVVALTGAGCSTESGIPDYRGPSRPPHKRPPIQHHEFVTRHEVRKRYWARSILGWPRFSAARPNLGHLALAQLEQAGVVAGVITQNVDGLHQAAGSQRVIELHGALAQVRCQRCGARLERHALQQRLLKENAGFLERAAEVALAPDGDAELPDELVADFHVVPCAVCGGELMPDVVFFGGTVPRPVVDAAWELFDRGQVLLVLGSSLTVFSGYRFVRRAAERGVPVAIINQGPTRGDPHAAVRLDAAIGQALPSLTRALSRTSSWA
ncbi:MAG: NAD-dependent protein deacetylase [Myxococcales bacterium]|nr:NAD-dependent protein deacetylase [Myxococcales bacterium]